MEKCKILCYNVDDGTLVRLKKLVSKLGGDVVKVAPCDFGRPIAVVASGVSSASNPLVSAGFNEGMAVFVSFPDAMLDVILAAMREQGIRIPLKAILTPTNALWNAVTLYNELCRERSEFNGK